MVYQQSDLAGGTGIGLGVRASGRDELASLMATPSPLRIGVLTTPPLSGVAREFFELFKTPWGFASDADQAFSAIVVSAQVAAMPTTARLVICAGSQSHPIDEHLGIKRTTLPSGTHLSFEDRRLPIHTPVAGLEAQGADIFLRAEDGSPVAVTAQQNGITVVRIGYDLFEEVNYLLSIGQSPEHAGSPSLDLHIELLRTALLAHGVPVVEIAPYPYGHPFVVCLTHDIDFISICDHRLDHTFFGFVYRVFRSLLDRPRRWSRIRKNFAALISVPAVHLGLAPDFWDPMPRYSTIEGKHPSTYFFIPFRGRRGRHSEGARGRYRAAPYDVAEYSQALQKLEEQRREVAVHGIDAWCDREQGQNERRVLQGITGRQRSGIRMHWLYFAETSPCTLEEAGYVYDSTLGFNQTVGYRNGTTQVFRPRGATTLLELPLNIQDTALFFPDRMHLSEDEALRRCRAIIADCVRLGGVLTVNWHDRSLAPERNWDEFYQALLAELERSTPWFAQARQAVAWYERRRSYTFQEVAIDSRRAVIRIAPGSDSSAAAMPPHCLRVSLPTTGTPRSDAPVKPRSIEVPLTSHDYPITVDFD